MIRFMTVLVFVLTVSVELAAQERDKPIIAGENVRADLKADVRQLLTSESAVDQAWGAYYTGKYGFTDLAPLLWALVKPDTGNYRDPHQRCVRSALIDLGVAADAEQFKLLLEKHWTVCALTAAINGKSAEQLLALMRTVPDTDIQIATCNQLVDMKHAELAKELLSRVDIKMDIYVWDEFGGGGRRQVMSCGDGSISVPQGYPPIVDYSLRRSYPGTGDIVLAAGRTTIYLRRREVADTSMGVGSVNSNFDLVQYRLTSLYELSGQGNPLPTTALTSRRNVNITWSTVEALETNVGQGLNAVQAEWQALKDSLVKDGLLHLEEAAALPITVSFEINDQRTKTDTPLPTAKDLQAKLLGAK